MMTTDEKRLLAQDLIGRQLYGLKFEYTNRHGKTTIQTLDSVVHVLDQEYKVLGDKDTVEISNCKPYLFPEGSIEKEIEFYGRKLKILDELEKEDIVIVQRKGTWKKTIEYEIIDYTRYYDALDSFHVDYRGLCFENLAIEINKENNPYR